MMDEVQTLEAPVVYAPGYFDISLYLEAGRRYDHLSLIRLFWQVGDLGLYAQEGDPCFRIGKSFNAALYQGLEDGSIEMTLTVDGEGNPCDFWTGVFLAKHPANKDFKRVDGWLMLRSS